MAIDDGETTNVQSINIKKDPSEAVAEAAIRMAPNLARLRKALFDSYIKEGFSEEQSLVLCTR